MTELRIFDRERQDYDSGGTPFTALSGECEEEAGGDYSITLCVTREEAEKRKLLPALGRVITVPAGVKHFPQKYIGALPAAREIFCVCGPMRQITKQVTRRSGGIEYPEEYRVNVRGEIPVYATPHAPRALFFLCHGDEVTLLKDEGSRWLCLCKNGKCGYIPLGALRFQREEQGSVLSAALEKEGTASLQPFRVYSMSLKDGRLITLKARHIYFDSAAEDGGETEFCNAPLSAVCEKLTQMNGIITFRPAGECYITGVFTGSAAGIAAELCEKYGLQLIRDGREAWLLPGNPAEKAFTAETGKDITAFEISEDASGTVTRFIPCVDGAEYDSIDSDRAASQYPVRSERVEGDTYDDALRRISQRVEQGCDLPRECITVACVPGALEEAGLYDAVTVKDAASGTEKTGRITRLVRDVICPRTVNIRLGSTAREEPGKVLAERNSWNTVV